MTDPEKMVWAAAFAAASKNHGPDPSHCAYEAWLAVVCLRNAQTADELVEWRQMLREFRDAQSIPATVREFKNAKNAAEIECLVAEAIRELHDEKSTVIGYSPAGVSAIKALDARIERKLGRPLRGG